VIPQNDLASRAQRIKVIGFDVDGVCTDGRIWYGPDGEALHAFHTRDGLGIVLARKAGVVLVAVTGRNSPNVAARLTELKVPHILQGVAKKAETFGRVLAEIGATWEEAAFIGDDINDVPCLRRAGLAACVPDAADGVAEFAHVVTRRRGGEGALRELIEIVLRAQGRWNIEGESTT
jgi:3-deoxy-D-manno-octulosonate 8-phosphate phosphatase (KDO 8-P phosphatase)